MKSSIPQQNNKTEISLPPKINNSLIIQLKKKEIYWVETFVPDLDSEGYKYFQAPATLLIFLPLCLLPYSKYKYEI